MRPPVEKYTVKGTVWMIIESDEGMSDTIVSAIKAINVGLSSIKMSDVGFSIADVGRAYGIEMDVLGEDGASVLTRNKKQAT